MTKDVVIIDIIESVVSSMRVAGISDTNNSNINFQPGRSIQILKSLDQKNQAPSKKGKKYPLIGMLIPIREERELQGYYATATFPRIIISTFSNGTSTVLERYKDGGTFKSILYPCYYEFLFRLAKSPSIIGSDPNGFKHTKMDNPAVQPIGEGLSDYVDSIEILNLELILNQLKTC